MRQNDQIVRSLSVDWFPGVDIYLTPDGLVVKVEAAGVNPKELIVSVLDHTLCIKGQRKDEFIEKDWVHLSMEIYYSSFERVIEMPEDADLANMTTQYRDGMLIIKIRKQKRESHGAR